VLCSYGYLHDYYEGNKVTATDTFYIKSKEEGAEGTRDLTFKFDSTQLKDHIVVAYENLYLLDENDPEYKIHIAIHEDMSYAYRKLHFEMTLSSVYDKLTKSDCVLQ
jgi:hypothetical protein